MRLRYALYERTDAGYGWTWRASELSDVLLGDFYHRVEIPTDSNSIGPGDVRGGVCKFSNGAGGTLQDHVVFYRFFDGGSDAGRPNRVVMLAGWTTPGEVKALSNPFGIHVVLRSRMFEYVSENSHTIGIQQPPFCKSLVGEEDVPASQGARVPHAALLEFVDEALSDPSNDYDLAVRGNEYTVSRRRPVGRERSQRAKQSADSSGRPDGAQESADGTSKRRDSVTRSGRRTPSESLSQGPNRKGNRRSLGLVRAVVIAATLCAVAGVLGTVRYKWPWAGDIALTQEAEEILRLFGRLAPDEKQRVMRQLEDLCRAQQGTAVAQPRSAQQVTGGYFRQQNYAAPAQGTRQGGAAGPASTPSRDFGGGEARPGKPLQ